MGRQHEQSPHVTAAYIEDMLAELRGLSQSINADFLAYLIEMAMIEASDTARGKHDKIDDIDPKSPIEMARLYMVGELE